MNAKEKQECILLKYWYLDHNLFNFWIASFVELLNTNFPIIKQTTEWLEVSMIDEYFNIDY